MSLPDIDWSSDYERGYDAALGDLLNYFQAEYEQAVKEDPHFAYYSEYVVNVIKHKINPMIRDNE